MKSRKELLINAIAPTNIINKQLLKIRRKTKSPVNKSSKRAIPFIRPKTKVHVVLQGVDQEQDAGGVKDPI